MLSYSQLLPLLSLALPFPASLPLASATATGSFSLRQQNPGLCVLLAQITPGTPATITAMQPVCSAQEITLPLTTAGAGANSDYAIYAQIQTVEGYGGNTGKPACVTHLYNSEVGQLFGNSWIWNTYLSEMYNAANNQFLVIGCSREDETLNPSYLYLPNPYQLSAGAGEFHETIPIVAPPSKRQVAGNVTEIVKGEVRNRMRP